MQNEFTQIKIFIGSKFGIIEGKNVRYRCANQHDVVTYGTSHGTDVRVFVPARHRNCIRENILQTSKRVCQPGDLGILAKDAEKPYGQAATERHQTHCHGGRPGD
jgi:hypothetical protein